MRGWDKNGVPTQEKIAGAGIGKGRGWGDMKIKIDHKKCTVANSVKLCALWRTQGALIPGGHESGFT